jgi:two-component system cell cycle sensor histidine kinase/response regulator CckA
LVACRYRERVPGGVAARTWDVVISDFHMPTFDGLRAFALFRESGLDAPFIFVSGALGEERAVEAMRSGAADYLLKENLARLPVAVGRELAAAAARRERSELEEQLRQAHKMEAIGQLAGGIAHDFNNLLTAISGFSQFALMEIPEDHNARQHIDQVLRAADRAATLTAQLLAFSRRKTVRPRIVAVDAVVRDVLPMLRTMLGEDVTIEHAPDTEPSMTEIDPVALEQVIMNLAVNARDAMPRGGRLRIECRNVEVGPIQLEAEDIEGPTDFVCLSVADDGVGMDESVRERIFEPFFTTKEPGQGTGLGLATCYGIVKQAGGFMRVHSVAGEGTRFELYLPRSAGKVAQSEIVAEVPISLEGMETVLIAEDDAQVRELMIAVLEAYGYEVIAASDAAEALERLLGAKDRIRLLVTDVIMPGQSGVDLAKRLQGEALELRILYVSGYSENVLTTRGMLPADARVLQKPFAPDEFLREVRITLDA